MSRFLLRGHDDTPGRLRSIFTALALAAVAVMLLTVAVAISGPDGSGVLIALDVVAALALGVLLYMAYLNLRDTISTPMNLLVEASRRIAGGDLREPEHGEFPAEPMELRQVGDSLIRMAAALRLERGRRADDHNAGVKQAMTFRQLMRVSQAIGAALNNHEVLKRFALGARELGSFDMAAIWTVDEPAKKLLQSFSTVRGRDGSDPVSVAIAGTALGRATSSSQPVPLRAEGKSPAGLAIPIALGVGLSVVAVLEVRGPQPPSDDLVDVLETLASHTSTALHAAGLHREMELRSETDPLTKVSNRRRLEADLKSEVARSLRYGHSLSLVMVDVDHFKSVNDDFGHQQGDEVLKRVAQSLASDRRETDSVYRFGGEEFSVLLRETDAQGAAEVAERLRANIPAAIAAVGLEREVTASFGVATAGGDVVTAEQLVEAADSALYQAKESGRNRVVSAPSDVANR